MKTKFYNVRKTKNYRDAEAVYILLPEDNKHLIANLVGREIYSTLLFVNNVLCRIDGYAEKFFRCNEQGISYKVGCYFQRKEYTERDLIEEDIKNFTSLSKVFNSNDFPEEYHLIQDLVKDLQWFLGKWDEFEKEYSGMFY